MELLWPAGIRPAWRLVVRRELEGYARRGLVPGDDREVRFLPRDRQAEQFRVEGGEGRRIRAVDDHMMQASDHGRDPAMRRSHRNEAAQLSCLGIAQQG